MMLKKNPLNVLVLKSICSIIILYLLFVPVYYIMIDYHISKQDNVIWDSILVALVRVVFIILTGIYIRKKSNSILSKYKEQKKLYTHGILKLIGIYIVLYFLEIPEKMYRIIITITDVDEMAPARLFLPVLCEQLFGSYLLLSILVCLIIVFFDISMLHIPSKNIK